MWVVTVLVFYAKQNIVNWLSRLGLLVTQIAFYDQNPYELLRQLVELQEHMIAKGHLFAFWDIF